MSRDYEKLGFKCGLEIHQQLEGSKLFCNCPTVIRKDKPDFEIRRKLRASVGETGKADMAALFEVEKGKSFVYQGYENITCLVETDEEPPHPINQDALEAVLQICKMLNANIVDQIQVMRKIVVDGSNVSGFQRTALIGMNGHVEVSGKRIGIETICLEEDACQAMRRTKDYDVYNLSRLGIPLLEIATEPGISSPEECKEVAAKIGMILRSTGKMKRGIGSIRQDVNLSIKGAGRIEIKGFQDLKSIPRVIKSEVDRQLRELKKGKKVESHVRKAEPDFTTSYLRPMPGAERMYPETDIPKIATPPTDKIEIPKLLEEKAGEYEEGYGLPEGYGQQLVKMDIDFHNYAERFKNVDRTVLAEFFITYPKDLRKREGIKIEPEDHIDVLEHINTGRIPKSAINDILLLKGKGKKVDYSRYESASEEEIRKVVEEVLKKDPHAPVGALMGQAMTRLKGRAEGKRVMELLKKLKNS